MTHYYEEYDDVPSWVDDIGDLALDAHLAWLEAGAAAHEAEDRQRETDHEFAIIDYEASLHAGDATPVIVDAPWATGYVTDDDGGDDDSSSDDDDDDDDDSSSDDDDGDDDSSSDDESGDEGYAQEMDTGTDSDSDPATGSQNHSDSTSSDTTIDDFERVRGIVERRSESLASRGLPFSLPRGW